ncbi:MAG: glycosyltransferase [Deltaproteobacteria bacterium]
MRRKSILILTNTYPDFDSSNRGIFIKGMALLLQKEGYDVSVVTPRIFKESFYFEKQDGIKVYRFPFFARDKLLIEYKKIPYLKMILYYISGFLLTVYVLQKNRCSLVHTHWAIPTGLIGIWASAFLRIPHIVTIHGSDFRLAMESASLLKKIFYHVCKRANYIHCVSEVMRRGIEALGIEGAKISTFPMGVDETFFEAGRNRKSIMQKGRDFKILSNRNLLPIYNVSLLIRSIPMVLEKESKIRFLIAGDGTERESLQKEVEYLNVGSFVQFLGRIPHSEMPNLLADTDIYVSTSLYDGTSVSLLEAMACGAFPIVTDILSNREWISDGENGFLVPTDDTFVLAAKIIKVLRLTKLSKESCERNRKIVEEKAHWNQILRNFTRIYDSFLSR